jgi:4-aminobutyrate aminotransferase
VITAEKLPENAEKVGVYMKKRFQEMAEEHQLIGDVRGKGLILGVELVRNQKTKEPARIEGTKLCYRAWELGLIITCVGIYSNVIEITPPLILTKKQADAGLNIFEQALKDVEMGKVTDDKVRNYINL